MATTRYLTLASLYQAGSVIVMAVCFFCWSSERALAVLVAGGVMTANFWALRYFMAKALGGSRPKVAYAIALAGKFALVAAILAALVLLFELDGLGLAAGMSSLFVGIGLASIHGAFTPTARETLSSDSPPT